MDFKHSTLRNNEALLIVIVLGASSQKYFHKMQISCIHPLNII